MDGGEVETFGTLLRRHRQAAALSQEALAERARVSVAAVSALERGKRSVPRLETVGLLAEALGLAGKERRAFLAAARPSAEGPAPAGTPSQPAQTRLLLLPGRTGAARRAVHVAGGSMAAVAAPAPLSAPAGPQPPPFVGRATELRALEGHIQGA
jgi:transcriptional regulator with XRE-family HTH domain